MDEGIKQISKLYFALNVDRNPQNITAPTRDGYISPSSPRDSRIPKAETAQEGARIRQPALPEAFTLYISNPLEPPKLCPTKSQDRKIHNKKPSNDDVQKT